MMVDIDSLQQIGSHAIRSEADKITKTRSTAYLAIPKFLPDLDSKDFPKPLIEMAQLHIDLHRFLDTNKRAIIVVGRGFGKSQQVAIGRNLVEIGNNTDIRAQIVSENIDVASKRVIAVREHIRENRRYHKLYPNIKPSYDCWGSMAFSVQRSPGIPDPTLSAFGILTGATGGRGDLIVCDDICGEKVSRDKGARETVKQVFFSSIFNQLADDARLIYIGTPFHYDDLTMNLMEGAPGNGFNLFFRPVGESCESPWEAKWSRDKLMEKRKFFFNNGRAGEWYKGYLCKPLSDEDARFDRKKVDDSIILDRPAPIDDIIGGGKTDSGEWIILMTVDPAWTKNKRSDYTVIFVGAVNKKSKKRVPLDITRKKLHAHEIGLEIIRLENIWNPKKIYIEKAANQESLKHFTNFISEEPLNIEAVSPKGNKEQRQFDLSSSVSAGLWEIYTHQHPMGTDSIQCPCGFCAFIEELITCPSLKHDDCLDAGELFDRKAADETKSVTIIFDII